MRGNCVRPRNEPRSLTAISLLGLLQQEMTPLAGISASATASSMNAAVCQTSIILPAIVVVPKIQAFQ
jgi:hypothetical protein